MSGGAASRRLAGMLRSQVGATPFTDSPWQWGVVSAVHSASSSTTLSAAVSAGATSFTTGAALAVNDWVLVGGTAPAVLVTGVSGSAAPYTVTVAQGVPAAAASGAAVTVLNTLDVYFDGTQQLGDTSFLTVGVRWVESSYPTQTVGDVVVAGRGQGGLSHDRFVVGKLA